MAGDSATSDSDAASGGSGPSRWVVWGGLLLLGLVLAFGSWWVVRSDALAASQHQRIRHEVDIAARLIEQWPTAVRSMAQASLLPSRLEPILPANEDDGWRRAAHFQHPTLGPVVVEYSLANDPGCLAPPPTTPSPSGTAGYVAFLDAEPRMIVAGRLGVAGLWYADERARTPVNDVQRFDETKNGPGFITSLFPPPAGTSAKKLPATVICFKTVLRLDRIVDLDQAAPDLEKLLLIDRSGRVLAQLGGTPLPLANVRELAPLRPSIELEQLLAVAETGLNGTKPMVVTPPKAADDPGDRSAPVKVTVGGLQYFAYSRALNLHEFPATECAPDAKEAAGVVATATSAATTTTCLVIGLVPTSAVTAASLQLPPAVLVEFGLALALIVALFPVLKLRLIGSSDSLSRVEVVAIAVGSIAAVATATLALLSAAALFADEWAEIGRARTVAAAMSSDFQHELTAMLELPVQVELLDAGAKADTPVEPSTIGLSCPPAGGAAKGTVAGVVSSVLVGDRGEGAWPVREASLMFDDAGKAWPGFRPVYNHCFGGSRTDIGDRHYFLAAMSGDGERAQPPRSAPTMGGITLRKHYVIAAVRSRPDGINKAIVATPFDRNSGSPDHGALIESFIPRAFLSPVLPAPLRFLVVDADDPAFAVYFGSDPYRVGIDRLIDDVPSKRAIAAIADVRCPPTAAKSGKPGCTARTAMFAARYEGVSQRFVAQGLPGTPWVLLVYFPDNAVATLMAGAAVLAAGAWSGLVLVVALVLTGIGAMWLRRRLWQWAWPRPGGAEQYRRALRLVVQTTGITLAAGGVLSVTAAPIGGVARLLLALAATIAIVVAVARQLGRAAPPESAKRFLDPADEHAFRNLAIALLLVVGAGPVTALWYDARLSTFAIADAENSRALTASIEANARDHRAIMKAFGTQSVTTAASTAEVPPGLYARLQSDLHAAPDTERDWLLESFTARLHDWSFGDAPTTRLSCAQAALPATTLQGTAMTAFCGPAQPTTPVSRLADVSAVGLLAILLLAIGMGTLLLTMFDSILSGLFGHGIPLEAVTYPGVRRASDGRLKLSAKALVLNAPLALQLELLESRQLIDVSDPLAPPELTADCCFVVTGLALSLRSPDLRVRALELLETLSRRVDHINRTADHRRAAATADGVVEPPQNPTAQLIVITDLSPLDRVLQAYEAELALAGADRAVRAADGRREQLRWSRLFESFATIAFRAATKISAWPIDAIGDGLTLDERHGIATLVEEVRELPEVVIDSLIDTPEGRIARYWKRHTRTRSYPFDPALYRAFYDCRVRVWARSVQPASAAAAIDYLRGTLIEHYQYAWIASSHSERVILDSLARGRTVNIATSFALRSLIRRGLIKLSPIPELINRSFAAFVRQAEKPLQIKAWRDEQPRSAWQRYSPPLLALLPVAIVCFAALASSAGDSAVGLLPLLLGAAPAMIGTLTGARKPA